MDTDADKQFEEPEPIAPRTAEGSISPGPSKRTQLQLQNESLLQENENLRSALRFGATTFGGAASNYIPPPIITWPFPAPTTYMPTTPRRAVNAGGAIANLRSDPHQFDNFVYSPRTQYPSSTQAGQAGRSITDNVLKWPMINASREGVELVRFKFKLNFIHPWGL